MPPPPFSSSSRTGAFLPHRCVSPGWTAGPVIGKGMVGGVGVARTMGSLFGARMNQLGRSSAAYAQRFKHVHHNPRRNDPGNRTPPDPGPTPATPNHPPPIPDLPPGLGLTRRRPHPNGPPPRIRHPLCPAWRQGPHFDMLRFRPSARHPPVQARKTCLGIAFPCTRPNMHAATGCNERRTPAFPLAIRQQG